MQTIAQQTPCHRTKCMEQERAERFARCLQANPLFTAVEIAESARARSAARYFVTYLPVNADRVADLVNAEQDKRLAKAATEGRDYLFVLDTDSAQPFCWCCSTSGETYEVTLFDCSCPDFQYRLKGCGIQCKHMAALSARINNGEIRRW